MRILSHPVARALLAGALVGLLVLGVGGRVVMAAITANAGGTPRYTVGETLTVVMLVTVYAIVLAIVMSRGNRTPTRS